jgi:hypothetical protein
MLDLDHLERQLHVSYYGRHGGDILGLNRSGANDVSISESGCVAALDC